jgi:hypothetical protein
MLSERAKEKSASPSGRSVGAPIRGPYRGGGSRAALRGPWGGPDLAGFKRPGKVRVSASPQVIGRDLSAKACGPTRSLSASGFACCGKMSGQRGRKRCFRAPRPVPRRRSEAKAGPGGLQSLGNSRGHNHITDAAQKPDATPQPPVARQVEDRIVADVGRRRAGGRPVVPVRVAGE